MSCVNCVYLQRAKGVDMGILDTLRERFGGAPDDEYYDDEYYEDDEYDEGDAGQLHVRETSSSNRLLGNPSRPEAESVSVYTRSGRPVSATPAASYEQQRSQSRAQASAAAPMQASNTLNFQQPSRVRSKSPHARERWPATPAMPTLRCRAHRVGHTSPFRY